MDEEVRTECVQLKLQNIKLKHRVEKLEKQMANLMDNVIPQLLSKQGVEIDGNDGDLFGNNISWLNKNKVLSLPEFEHEEPNLKNYLFHVVIPKISREDIVSILNEHIGFLDYVQQLMVDCILEDLEWATCFKRDRARIYVYNFDDLVWKELKNNDLITWVQYFSSMVLTVYNNIIKEDPNFSFDYFERICFLYDHNIKSSITDFRRKMVTKILKNK